MGRVIHTEMQGGLDDGSAGLTAYVLTALLEDDSYVVRLQGRGTWCLSSLVCLTGRKHCTQISTQTLISSTCDVPHDCIKTEIRHHKQSSNL